MRRGIASIGLVQPKRPENVGSALRAAGCFDASMVAVTGCRYRRSRTDTSAAYRHLPLIQCEDLREVVPYGSVPVAVELLDDAEPITGYEHPESAMYVFGPEDGTLGKNTLSWCRDVIYVPTAYCLNLAAAVNIVLYDRLLKRSST